MQRISTPWFKCSSDLQAEQSSGSAVLPIKRTPPPLMLKENSLRFSTCNQVQAKASHGSHNPANRFDPMRYLLRLIAPVTALVAVSACGPQVPPQPPPPKVQAAAARLVEFTEGIDTVSTLEASNLVELAAQSGGRIEQLKIRQGDEVEAGQLLLVLDQDKEKANADTAKANYERYAYLAQMGATSQKELDRYRTQYIEAKAKLDYTNLRSPSTGTVADVKVKVGDVIQQGQVFTAWSRTMSWKQGWKCQRFSRLGCRRASSLF